jgi:hypothetical protein
LEPADRPSFGAIAGLPVISFRLEMRGVRPLVFCGTNQIVFESILSMPALHSDQSHSEIDRTKSRSYAMMKEWRARLFTMGWGAAVVVATAGWVYFIARLGWSIVNWFFR